MYVELGLIKNIYIYIKLRFETDVSFELVLVWRVLISTCISAKL